MKIVAIDDEKLQLQKLEKTIRSVVPECELISFQFPSDMIKWIESDGKCDIAFLDIELGSMSGIQMAKKLQSKNPKVNIIFVTGHLEYAPEAFRVHASGYIHKPVTTENIIAEIENLRFSISKPTNKRMSVTCFGKFEVLVDGVPLNFKREKAKELFAFLVDKKGAFCSPREICASLWEEDKFDYLRKLVQELSKTLKSVGLGNIFVREFKKYRVEPSLFKCDYYDYLDDKPWAIKSFHGVYMEQYSWAESTQVTLC